MIKIHAEAHSFEMILNYEKVCKSYREELLSVVWFFNIISAYVLKFHCLLVDFQILIGSYSKFGYPTRPTYYNELRKCTQSKEKLVSRHWHFSTFQP